MVSPAAQASRTVAGPAAAAAVNPASTPVSGTPATTSLLLAILAVHAIGRLPLLHPTLGGFTLDADAHDDDDDDNDDADEHRVLVVMLMVMLRVCVT